MNARNAIGAGSGGGPPKAGSGPVSLLTSMWRETPEHSRDSVTKDRMMRLYVRSEAQRLTNIRAGQNRRKGNPGPEMSIAKLAFAELNQDLLTAAVDMMGMAGQVDYDYTFGRWIGKWYSTRLFAGACKFHRRWNLRNNEKYSRGTSFGPPGRTSDRQGRTLDRGS